MNGLKLEEGIFPFEKSRRSSREDDSAFFFWGGEWKYHAQVVLKCIYLGMKMFTVYKDELYSVVYSYASFIRPK